MTNTQTITMANYLLKSALVFISIVAMCCCTSSGVDNHEFMSRDEREKLKEESRDMFYHAYNAYMDNAYPADELMPLSCKGRYRGTETDRGDIDSVLGNFSLTLVDTLDTLVVLGDLGEFENAVKLVVRDVTFDTDVIVSLFETNIRMLGGLLSGHILSEYLQLRADIMPWYRGELLTLAKDLGYRFLPAFNTSTGIPYGRINLKYGMKTVPSEMCRETCTACAGSMILEMAALSRLTGEQIFEDKAQKAMDALWKIRHRGTDLMGSVLNVHSGDWVRRDSGVGAGIDSYYEYCLKAYILLGDEKYLGRFNKHYQAVMKYVSQGPMLLDVHMHRPNTNSKNFMDALLAFWPGLQVLKGDIKPAVETHEMLYQVMQRHNFIPEAFTTDFQVHWGHHPLRPEFLESTYFLYRATGDHYYLGVGRKVLKSLQTYARVPCGYAAVSDVRTNKHDDTMDSFVLSETLKYLYLLFAEPNDLVLDLDEFIFTTEGHLLPLTLAAMRNNATLLQSDIDIFNVDELDRTCPNSLHLFPASVRQPLRNMVEDVCPRRLIKRRLSASQFQSTNLEHLKLLSNMGIIVLTTADGRMQLLHTFANAKTMEDAQEGLMFMQDMVELNRKQSLDTEKRRLAINFARTYVDPVEEVTLVGGPAEFGLQLKGLFKVIGKPVMSEPDKACSELINADKIKGNIAVMFRGDCMFVDKARIIQKAGAIGGIVLDTVVGSSIATSPIFGMAGDGVNVDDIKIPMSFLFNVEAYELLQSISDSDGTIFITIGEYTGDETKTNDSDDFTSMFERLKTSVKEFLTRPSTPTEPKTINPKPPMSTIKIDSMQDNANDDDDHDDDDNDDDVIIERGHLRAIIPEYAKKIRKLSTKSLPIKLTATTTKRQSKTKDNVDDINDNNDNDDDDDELAGLMSFEKGWRAFKRFFVTQIHTNTLSPPNQVITINRIEIYYDWLHRKRNVNVKSGKSPSDKIKLSDNLTATELVTWFLDELSDTPPNYDSEQTFNSILSASQSLAHKLKPLITSNDRDTDTIGIIDNYKVYGNLLENIQDVLINLRTQLQHKAYVTYNSINNNDNKRDSDDIRNLQRIMALNIRDNHDKIGNRIKINNDGDDTNDKIIIGNYNLHLQNLFGLNFVNTENHDKNADNTSGRQKNKFVVLDDGHKRKIDENKLNDNGNDDIDVDENGQCDKLRKNVQQRGDIRDNDDGNEGVNRRKNVNSVKIVDSDNLDNLIIQDIMDEISISDGNDDDDDDNNERINHKNVNREVLKRDDKIDENMKVRRKRKYVIDEL